MKFLIVGAGGTGGSIGGFLASSGYDVTFIARGEHLKKIKESGLRLKSGIKGNLELKNVKAFSSEDYNDSPDVIFICVKAYSLDEILPLLKRVSHKDTVIIPILNGIGIGDKIYEKFKDAYVLDGCVYIVGYVSGPGEITHMGKFLRVVYGERKNQAVPYDKLLAINEVLTNSGIKGIISDNIVRDTFQKFSFVSAYATCGAFYNVNASEMRDIPEHRETFRNLVREIQEIASAMGLSFEIDLLPSNLKILDAMEPESTASMQKDLVAGKHTEMDGLIFEVVRLADEYGVSAPNYKKIAKSFGYNNQ